MILRILLVGTGGFVGAVARYLIDTGVTRLTTGAFPYGTLSVNALGSFLLGILGGLVLTWDGMTEGYQLVLMTGLIGSLTTFSTFSYESIQLLEKGFSRAFLLYIAGNVLICLLLAWAGLSLVRQFS